MSVFVLNDLACFSSSVSVNTDGRYSTPVLCCRTEVMEQIIQSSDLFVMQVEMDVYTALKKVTWQHPPPPYPTPVEQTDPLQMFLKSSVLSPQWMFLQLNPSWDGPIKQLLADADAWLCKRRTGTTRPQRGGGESSLRVWTCGKTRFALQTCVRKNPS